MTDVKRRRRSSRDRILEEFTRLVAENGYDGAAISDVARAAGVSKGTVVHHFRDKQQMLEESHASYMNRRFQELNVLLQLRVDPAEQLAGVLYCLLRAHRDDHDANASFLREFSRFADQGSHELRSLRREYTTMVTGILRRGVLVGAFSDNIDLQITTLQIFGMCNYVWTWYRPDGPTSLESIAMTFVANLISGLRVSDPDRFTTSWFATLDAQLPAAHAEPERATASA